MVVATIWGEQTATKRVLLIHGAAATSQSCHRIAEEFATRGYFVIAPDLLGHGLARRSSVYTIAAMTEELLPLLKACGDGDGSHPYDVVIGESLGGIIAAALLPHLASPRPVRVILADPPFEIRRGQLIKQCSMVLEAMKNPSTPEEFLERYPNLTRTQAVIRSAGANLCSGAILEAIFKQNDPWSFFHLLATPPDNVKVTVLAADPSSKDAWTREEDLKVYPHIKTKSVWGASHMLPVEALLEAALNDESNDGVCITCGSDLTTRDDHRQNKS